jgi:lauroyl/myristoyl acyltransferase
MVVVRMAPRFLSFYFLWLLTITYFLIHKEDRKNIRNNIAEVFGRDCKSKQIAVLFKSTLTGIFHHYFEKLFLACTSNRRWKEYFLERIHISRRRLLDQVLAKNRGVILVTAHFGAVEFLPGFLSLLGYPVAIVAKFKTQRLREKCREKAKNIDAVIIDANEENSFWLANSALKEGRVLITQCDEVECWKAHPGRAIPVFGTFFRVDRTVAILQRRSKAPVLFGYVRREGKERYVADIEVLLGPDGKPQDRLEEMILKRFERLVYTYPDQWYIWKNFQQMKSIAREETTVEDRKSRDLPIAPPPVPVFQLSHPFPELYGQHRREGFV